MPHCQNIFVEYAAPFPSDLSLLSRWKECIEVGSGKEIADLDTLSEQGLVCNMHFLGFDLNNTTCYQQPTLFFRDTVVLEVESCALCNRIEIKENMLEKDAPLRRRQTLEDVVKRFYGTGYLRPEDSDKYLCQNCVAKIDIIKSFELELDDAKREHKQLQRRMAQETVGFQKNPCLSPKIEALEGSESTLCIEVLEVENIPEHLQYTLKTESEQKPKRVKERMFSIESTTDDDYSLYDDDDELLEIDRPKKNKRKHKRKIKQDDNTREKLEMSRRKCYICNSSWEGTDAVLSHLMVAHISDSLQCKECNVSFGRAPEYNNHLAKHDPEVRPFKCDHCPLRFAKASGRTIHTNLHHSRNVVDKTPKPRPRNYMCSTCGRAYRDKGELNRHEKVQHGGEAFVTCSTCKKSFASMRNLKRHLLIHRNEKPYVCKHCGVSYRQSQNLLDHMNEKHSEGPPELKYTCTECNAKFISCRLMSIHRQIHKGAKESTKTEKGTALASRSGGENNNKPICNLCNELFEKSVDILDHFATQHPDYTLKHDLCGTCGEIFFIKSSYMMI